MEHDSNGIRWTRRPTLCRRSPHFFFVHIQYGFLQPFLQTGAQLQTGRYARLLKTASPLPSLRFLRQ